MKLAFVIPWFHGTISGGAEAQCRDAAILLDRAGNDVTIMTTCIRDHLSDWNINHFPEGEATESGLRVLRFPADRTDRLRFDRINSRYLAMTGPEKHRLPEEEENFFFRSMAPSAALLRHIEENRDGFDFFIFIPYLFFSSVFGPALCGSKSVLIPCLHDEGYAYSRPVERSFAGAGGIIFNTVSEQQLASRIMPPLGARQAVVGDCIDLQGCLGDAESFRRRLGTGDPFALYLGRRDETKRTDMLVRYFLAYKEIRKSPLKLVLAGTGSVDTFGSPDILDVGFLSRDDKHGALAAAAFLCNPSLNESFSIVLLEAWANKRPVLVASGCQPTVELCRRSNGGLWFDSFAGFCAAVDFFTGHERAAAVMGESGRRFAERNYSTDIVAQKYNLLFRAWRSGHDPLFSEDVGGTGIEEGTPIDVLRIMKGVHSRIEDLPEPALPARSRGRTVARLAGKWLRKLRRSGNSRLSP